MPRYRFRDAEDRILWTPARARQEAEVEDDELGIAGVEAREWSFDPAFPMYRVTAATFSKPWSADEATAWLESEAQHSRDYYGPDDDYYRELCAWWQGANAHNNPLVLFEHPTVPDLFQISAGHHRFACAAKRNRTTVPAVVGRLPRWKQRRRG